MTTDATDARDLLIEIGTEELPPKALRSLSEALATELVAELEAAGFAPGTPQPYATPRRLAVLVPGVPGTQPDRAIERRGPPLARAFDENDAPTRAALGFAKSVGVEVDQLVRLETGEGAWLVWRSIQAGAPLASLLPGMLERVLPRLPAPRRMRWADRSTEFVRPVHWVVLMHGPEVIEGEVLGVASGRATRGHRFHHPENIELRDAGEYAATLRRDGHVVVGFEKRMAMIREQAERAAQGLGGEALIDPALLGENAALVEWPVVLAGHFDDAFLDLPAAVLVATMQGHQRYFPVARDDGALMPYFIAVSNIESRSPETVRRGNERVIRPRLSDAAYFFAADRRYRLESRLEGLTGVVFQRGLGTLHDKSVRVSELAARVMRAMGGAEDAVGNALRAGLLSKCDLLTEMVGEFPELQGEMGFEYARLDGEPTEVANALGEVYRPRFADDAIPGTATGRAVAIADKLDTIVGCLSLGQAPTGDKDPFALRRAALGTLRIMIEGELALDLDEMIEAAFECYAPQAPDDLGKSDAPCDTARAGAPDRASVTARTGTTTRTDATSPPRATTRPDAMKQGRSPRRTDTTTRTGTREGTTASAVAASPGAVAKVRRFMLDRLRAWLADRSIPTDVFNAVLATEPAKPLDFAHRVRAVEAFRRLPEAARLTAANKRIRNILRQAAQGNVDVSGGVDASLLHEGAERDLADALAAIEPQARTMLDAGEYTDALARLAGLRDAVDRFFDTVKVMDDDERLRGNRLALLARIGDLFMETADISQLQSTSG